MKATDYIVDFLVRHNINHMFGYPGATVCHLMDSAYKKEGMNLHLNYHEQACAFAACGYSMREGKPCVAYANVGPGMTNLVTGIADAWYDSLPVIFIVGQVDTYAMRNGLKIRQNGIQEIPSAQLVRDITKYSAVVESPSKLQECMESAYHIALSDRPGPVLLEIPTDIQRAELSLIEYNDSTFINKKVKDCNDGYKELLNSLRTSNRPCLLIGNGVKVSGNAKIMREAVEKMGIPVVFTLPAFDLLPYNHPYNYGFVGNNGNRYSNFILGKADLVISIGCRMDVKVVGSSRNTFISNAEFIRVDIDENELSYRVRDDEKQIVADAKEIFEYLKSITVNQYTYWNQICESLKKKLYGYDFKNYHIRLQKLFNRAQKAGTFCTDVGQHQIYTVQALQLKEGQKFVLSSGLASMGFGIPAAIGAYYESSKASICVCGDGGFLMNVQELQLISAEKLPITIIVFNNNSLGMIREFQKRNFEQKCVHSIKEYGYYSPDIEGIAAAFGIRYNKVITEEEIDTIELSDEPMIIDLVIDEMTELYPRYKRGASVQDMLPELNRDDYDQIMSL